MDPANGFPAWYEDSNGLRLAPFLDPGKCFALLPDPGSPVSFPNNFPFETFYWGANAFIDKNDGNKTELILTTEATFPNKNGQIVAEQQIVFTRVRAGGLTPGASYTVTRPCGVDHLTARSDGTLNFTEDVGYLAAPCNDFSPALAGRLGPFLTWDTFGFFTGAPPDRYLGDGVSPHNLAVAAATHTRCAGGGTRSGGDGVCLPSSRRSCHTGRGHVRQGGSRMEGNSGAAPPVRVLLADDHTMFRQGLAGVLATYGGVEVVAEVPNDGEALRLARDLEPDAVVMQVQMPFERARETLGAMRAFSRPPKVVLVTMFEEPRYVRELMGLGASAYLLKSSSAEHLVAAVRGAVFDPKGNNVVVGMPRSMLEGTPEGGESVLSARELEVLLLSARGLSNRQISRSLHLSEATVKRHLANIYPKMGVASRGEATRKALAENWITIEEITG